MKQLTCEMCGSTDVIKQDGLYVCQSCGTKYSPEEAKKMMVEGTVTIDKSSETKNLKILAKRYYDNGEYEKADDYYDRIIEADPHDWEAVYYGGLASAFRSSLDNSRLSEAIIGAENAINLVPEDERKEKIEEFRKELIVLIIHHGNWLDSIDSIDMGEVSVLSLLNQYYELVILSERLLSSFPPKSVIKDDQVYILYKFITDWCYSGSRYHKYAWGYETRFGTTEYKSTSLPQSKKNYLHSTKKEFEDKMAELDPDFKIELENKREKMAKSGCYIATSVYGSYDCPEVWTLRRFRDNTLAKTFYGRLFIKTYYAISPTLVKYFGGQNWFNNLFKPRLDKFVNKLQKDGVESTFYMDE